MQNDMVPSLFPRALTTSRNLTPDSLWTTYKIKRIFFVMKIISPLLTVHCPELSFKTCFHNSKAPALPSFWQKHYNKKKAIRECNLWKKRKIMTVKSQQYTKASSFVGLKLLHEVLKNSANKSCITNHEIQHPRSMAIDNWLTDFAWNPSKNVQSIEMITLLHWRTLQLSACSHSKSWSGHVQALSLFTFTDTNSHMFSCQSARLWDWNVFWVCDAQVIQTPQWETLHHGNHKYKL